MRLSLYVDHYAGGVPCGYYSYNGGVVRRAVLRYIRYMADPIMEEEPSRAQMRLICEYCAYWIGAPILTRPPELLAHLREQIEHVKLPHELTNWLAGCTTALGVNPLSMQIWGCDAT